MFLNEGYKSRALSRRHKYCNLVRKNSALQLWRRIRLRSSLSLRIMRS